MRNSTPWIAAAGLLLLAGCNGGSAPANGSVAAESGSTPAPAADGYVATDACATLPKEKVAAAAGLDVSGTELKQVTQPTGTTAGFSTCTYSFAGGGSLDFFARQSPVDDNTPEAIAAAKQAQIENMGAKPVDVPGLGTAAFSVAQANQLHVFYHGNRYFFFMAMTPPKGKPIAEVQRTLAAGIVG